MIVISHKPIFFVVACSIGVGCFAAPSNVDKCPAESLDSQGIYQCSKEVFNQADGKLNVAYKELISKISSDYKAHPSLGSKLKSHLTKSQRAWILLRDENCAIESFVTPHGTIAFEITKNFCIARESNVRTEYLRNLTW